MTSFLRNRRVLCALLVIPALIAILLSWSSSTPARESSGGRAPESTSRAASPSSPGVALAAIASHDVVTYDVRLEGDATIHLAILGSGATSTRMEGDLQGELERITLSRDPERAVELLRIPRAIASRRAGDQVFDEAVLAAALETGIVVERSSEGAVVRVRLPRDAGDAAPLLRQLAEQLQLAPARATIGTWSAKESSVLGALAVRYQQSSDDAKGATTVSRTLEEVETTAIAPDGTPYLVTAIEGRYDATFGDHGPETIEGGYRATTTITGVEAPLSIAALTFSLQRTGARPDPALLATLRAGLDDAFGPWTTLEAQTAPTAPGSAGDADKALIAGRDLSRLLADIRSTTTDDKRSPELAALVAYLRAHPEAAAEIARQLAGSNLGDAVTRGLVAALAKAGTDAAQAALVDVVQAWRRNNAQDATSLVPYLGMQRTPSAATEAFLAATSRAWDQGPELASSATLALGNVAQRVAGADADRATAITDGLLEQLPAAQGTNQIASTLAALGNTADRRASAAIGRYVDHPDVFVRETAARVLAKTEGDDIDRVLAGRVAAEADIVALAHVLDAIAERPAAAITVDAMANRLSGGLQGHAALQVVDAIGRGLALTASARPALERAAASDDREIAARARRHLGG